MVFEKSDWDVKTFNVDRDLPFARQKTAAALDAVNPDLSAFRSHGGKLILYHGWNDPVILALNTANYCKNELLRRAWKMPIHLFVSTWFPVCNTVSEDPEQTASGSLRPLLGLLIRSETSKRRLKTGWRKGLPPA